MMSLEEASTICNAWAICNFSQIIVEAHNCTVDVTKPCTFIYHQNLTENCCVITSVFFFKQKIHLGIMKSLAIQKLCHYF